MIKVQVKLKSATFNFSCKDEDFVIELKTRISDSQKMQLSRIRLEIDFSESQKVVLKNEGRLFEYKKYMKDDILPLLCKDLGSQIGYNYLFYIEYCFPPLSTLAFYLYNYKKTNRYHSLLTLLILFHFGKRLLETKFVHIFSNPSVPFKVLIRNCIHYWVLIGLLVPIEVFNLRKMSFPKKLGKSKISLFVLFFIFEFLNFVCHLKLRKLRTSTNLNGKREISNERKIPSGLFFDSIISPNYTFEILSWAAFTLLFKSYVSAGFTLISAGIMTQWSGVKKKRLLELEDATPEEKRKIRKRWLTLPLLI